MKKREGNYDLLRIVCTIGVILIHVSAAWFNRALADDIEMPAVICIYNSITRFAVPCFIMLSGAFILDNDKNLDYKTFYAKSFSKVGVQIILFSLIYVIYRILLSFAGLYGDISSLLLDIAKGEPMYHMWYLYMLVGVYAMAPIVLRFKNSISEKAFYKVSFVFLVLASVSRWTTKGVAFHWDIGQSFEYLGYFMAGYSIRRICQKKSNAKAFAAIIFGLLFELCAAGFEYGQLMEKIAEEDLKYSIVTPYCPWIVAGSVLIFYGFSLFDIKKDFAKCSNLTFFIYLIHVCVWDFVGILVSILTGSTYLTDLNGAVWVILIVVLVFILSYYVSKLYLWGWNKLDQEKRVTRFLVRMVHLQQNEL